MAAIKIRDLHASRVLDRTAMSAIRGGGAPWVFGWISPYIPESARLGPVINFIVNNNYFADQMNNQFQTVDIDNFAANSNIAVDLEQLGNNSKH